MVSLTVPQSAQAVIVANPAGSAFGVPISDIVGNTIGFETIAQTTISAIHNALSYALDVTNTAAQVAQQVNMAVLQPLAFVLSGNLMKALTGSVIAFVIGKANGTGVPQFIVDVQKSMQTVADGQALAFFDQIGRNSPSIWNTSIAAQLRKDYLNKTSLEGFWRKNLDTLARTSPNPRAFVVGRWSQGGLATWFALTTRVENNPYMKYQGAQSKLAAVVGPGTGGKTGARSSEIGWGQGFMSWCSPTDGAQADSGAVYTMADAQAALQTCMDNPGGSFEGCQPAYESYKALIGQPKNMVQGVNPGDPCTKSDGTAGTIRTPGTTIKATLDKVLGGQQDQIVRMGNIGPQVNQILGNIATVMQTVQFASQILGGPGSGGLFGVDAPTATNKTPRLIQYQNTPGYMGTNYSNVVSGLPPSGADMPSRINDYRTAWNTIRSAAAAASASATALAVSCTAQADAAQGAIVSQIGPVLVDAQTASSTIATAEAMVKKVQAEAATGGAQYVADMQALQTMSPTMAEVAGAQQQAIPKGEATAIPTGSLTVTGGTTVDRMNLLKTNVEALAASCAP